MTRRLGWFVLLMCFALWSGSLCAASDRAVMFLFEPASTRPSVGFEAALDRLTQMTRESPDSGLILFHALQKNVASAKFLQARKAVLLRALAERGLTIAVEKTNPSLADQESLVIAIEPKTPSSDDRSSSSRSALPAVSDAGAADWVAPQGGSLRLILQEWAQRAGWSVVWQSRYDYPIEAAAQFSGDFPTAASSVIQGFAEADPPPTARIFRANQVLIVK